MMCWVGRDLKDLPVPLPCHGQGHLPLDQVVQSPIQPGLEHCQGGVSPSVSGQFVPVPHHPPGEEFLPSFPAIGKKQPPCILCLHKLPPGHFQLHLPRLNPHSRVLWKMLFILGAAFIQKEPQNISLQAYRADSLSSSTACGENAFLPGKPGSFAQKTEVQTK